MRNFGVGGRRVPEAKERVFACQKYLSFSCEAGKACCNQFPLPPLESNCVGFVRTLGP